MADVTFNLFATGEHPCEGNHLNLHKFTGVLTVIGTPSDKAPSGARGHRVIVTREAAEAALPGLLCMAIDYKAGWDGHDARQKCGIITEAKIEGDEVQVSGYIYKQDFPEIVASVHSRDMGMSFEMADAHVEDLRAVVWTLNQATFTGAAIVLREKAAYQRTCFVVA